MFNEQYKGFVVPTNLDKCSPDVLSKSGTPLFIVSFFSVWKDRNLLYSRGSAAAADGLVCRPPQHDTVHTLPTNVTVFVFFLVSDARGGRMFFKYEDSQIQSEQ